MSYDVVSTGVVGWPWVTVHHQFLASRSYAACAVHPLGMMQASAGLVVVIHVWTMLHKFV